MNLAIPRNSIFRPVVNLFTATFNSPTLGYYSFTGGAAQDVLQINGHNLFYIASMNFSLTIPESDFVENIVTTPKVQFSGKQSGLALGGIVQPYPLVKYLTDNQIGAFFWSKQEKDTLSALFTGLLSQNAALISFPTITAILQMNIFEITDTNFIKEFHGLTQGHQPVNQVSIPANFDRRF